jgi:hypothetical protein
MEDQPFQVVVDLVHKEEVVVLALSVLIRSLPTLLLVLVVLVVLV